MVEQKFCPKCGAEMDLSNLFISGRADCPRCGYQGLPVAQQVMQRPAVKAAIKREQEPKLPKESPEGGASRKTDILDIRDLSGKLAAVSGGLMLISLFSAPLRGFVPVAGLGLVMFGAAYLYMGRK